MTGVTVRDDRVLRLEPERRVLDDETVCPFVPDEWVETFPQLTAFLKMRSNFWARSDEMAGWLGPHGDAGIYYDPEYEADED